MTDQSPNPIGNARNSDFRVSEGMQTEKPCFVFPHVPKCGGTSLLKQFRGSGLNIIEDYHAYIALALIDANAEPMNTDGVDLIYGHFPIDRYVGGNFQYIALVRDPISRLISSFHFHRDWGMRYPEDETYFAKLGRRIASGEVDFLHYLKHAHDIRIVYKTFLRFWGRHRFVLVGRTEEYDVFCEKLSSLLAVPISAEVHERKSDDVLRLSNHELRVARELLFEEYHWFDRFIQM